MKPFLRTASLVAMLAASVVWLAGCNIKESKDGDAKKVNIETPVGSMNIQTKAGAKDIGLPIYPNSREKADTGGDSSSANISMGGPGFGMKLAVAAYVTDDPPEKVVAFYRDSLKTMGKVVECKNRYVGAHASITVSDDKAGSDELTCDKGGTDSGATELKVGTKKHQHIVAVKPEGKGSKFALVFVRTRDDKDTI